MEIFVDILQETLKQKIEFLSKYPIVQQYQDMIDEELSKHDTLDDKLIALVEISKSIRSKRKLPDCVKVSSDSY